MKSLVTAIAKQTQLPPSIIENILALLEGGATIPFIARYRKEQTGGASDEVLREFEAIYESAKRVEERKKEIKRLIAERATLTAAIEAAIDAAQTMRTLDDIYLPYKENKASKAATAIAMGLEPLAQMLKKADQSVEAFEQEAKKFVQGEVSSVAMAIQGAQDILAQEMAHDPKTRASLRENMARHGVLEVKPTKTFKEDGVYKHYVSHTEKVAFIPSHRYLAIMRGVKEKELSVKIVVDIARLLEQIARTWIPKEAKSVRSLLLEAYEDGLKRLLLPSIEREVHAEVKTRSDLAAIGVFGKNLDQLLMTPPVVKHVILGVDPGFRTGCKLAVIDAQGQFLDHATIFPTAPQNDYEKSRQTVERLYKKYGITACAIGNGTASHETQEFFARLAKEGLAIPFTVVSEAGASVYSASAVATQEYPHLDVTVRGAISIAQRLRDPMAALVKIDPKSLGIGQYQHDVDAKLLEKKLSDVTQDLVNRVGVDLNSASAALLTHVAGIGPKVAAQIVTHREKEGPFEEKKALLKVKGVGAKVYEQAAGFLRIKEGKNVLDNTGVHPERYDIAKKLLEMDLRSVSIEALAGELNIGVPTLADIVLELQKPGFDPRMELDPIPFKAGLTDISMLSVGSFVSGVVRNIADFGAFVDIGLKNDGLIHISKMSQKRIAHPLEVLGINQYLPQIEVIGIDVEKQKVSLSLI